MEQLLPPKGSDGRPPRYAESQGLNRVLAMAHLCVRLLAANFAPTAGDQSPPFTRPRRRNDPQTPGSAPSSPNRRHEYKPGDWSCMTCGYSNYAARRQCYKCQTPHPAEFNMQGYPMGVPMDSYFPAYRGQMQYPPRLRPYRMGGPLSPGGGSTGYVDSPAVSPLVGSAAGPNAGAIRHGSETTVTPPSVNSPSPATPSETAVGGTEWGSGFPTPSSPSTVTDPSQQLSPPRLTQKVLPGDWICGVCSVTNFSSRTECVSCRSGQHLARGTITMPMPSFPPTYGRPMMPMPMQMAYAVPGSMSPMGTQMIAVGMPQMNAAYGFPGSPGRDVHYGSKPRPSDRPGDWNCPNPSCKYHNYASRTQCYRCSTARPPYAGIGMDQFIRPGQPYVRLPAGMPMSPMPMSPSVWSSYPVQPGAPRIPVLFGGPAPFGYGYPTTMMQAPSDESQAEAEEEAFFGVEEQYIVETEVLVDQQHQEA